MNDEERLKLGGELLAYAKKFNVPIEYLFDILGDQKVIPMIRGKAMEYNAYLMLDRLLPKNVWSVQKLNLNAQQGTDDEDISITHRRTGVILKVESKSAVRGSITDGLKKRGGGRPGFKVKCHRSRSNIKLAGTSNDRYSIDCFDVLITTTANAIYQGKTIGEDLEIIHAPKLRTMLHEFYGVATDSDLIHACENDWRFVIPKDIAVEGFIPRTPFVFLADDTQWHKMELLENRLVEVVKEKQRDQTAMRR